jgi:hypothetical protein
MMYEAAADYLATRSCGVGAFSSKNVLPLLLEQ